MACTGRLCRTATAVDRDRTAWGQLPPIAHSNGIGRRRAAGRCEQSAGFRPGPPLVVRPGRSAAGPVGCERPATGQLNEFIDLSPTTPLGRHQHHRCATRGDRAAPGRRSRGPGGRAEQRGTSGPGLPRRQPPAKAGGRALANPWAHKHARTQLTKKARPAFDQPACRTRRHADSQILRTLSASPNIARLTREGEPANAVPQGLQGLHGASTLTAGFMILACAGDQPPVSSPARTVGSGSAASASRPPVTPSRASSH